MANHKNRPIPPKKLEWPTPELTMIPANELSQNERVYAYLTPTSSQWSDHSRQPIYCTDRNPLETGWCTESDWFMVEVMSNEWGEICP